MAGNSEQYREMIASARWRRVRRDILNRHPLCEICATRGVTASATEVHHVKPVDSVGNPQDRARLMFDYGNLVALCHDCHQQCHRDLGSRSKEGQRALRQSEVRAFAARYFGEQGEWPDD